MKTSHNFSGNFKCVNTVYETAFIWWNRLRKHASPLDIVNYCYDYSFVFEAMKATLWISFWSKVLWNQSSSFPSQSGVLHNPNYNAVTQRKRNRWKTMPATQYTDISKTTIIFFQTKVSSAFSNSIKSNLAYQQFGKLICQDIEKMLFRWLMKKKRT